MPKILDQFLNKLRPRQVTQALRERQTARVASLQKEFSTHPSRGLTPARMAAILEDAEHGSLVAQHDLFVDMEEKDGHILAEMGKRRRALVTLPWRIEPPPRAAAREQRNAEALAELLTDIPDLEDVILDAADGIGHGFSALEMEWDRVENYWLPSDIEHRPQSWFQLDKADRNVLRLRNPSNTDGDELQPFTWILHTHRAKPGYLARSGLHRTLAWPYLFKNYSVRDLAEFLEIYGLPIRLGTYPGGASDEEKGALLAAVTQLGHHAAGIIPEGMLLELKEAAKGAAGPFQAMIDWCERTESKVILGATLTTQTDSGSGAYALGEIHDNVRTDIRDSDAKQIQGTLTRDLVYPIAALNGLADHPRRCPRLIFDTREPEDLKLYAESLPPLVDAGMEIPERWARDKLGIPAREEGEPILVRAPGSAGFQPAAARAALKSARDPDDPDTPDRLADNLERAAAEINDQMVEQVRRVVMTAPTLEAARGRLYDLYKELPAAELAALMAQAQAVSDLAGRAEIEEDA
jgi:phage gp29-like protein